jgi:hypothetical protein
VIALKGDTGTCPLQNLEKVVAVGVQLAHEDLLEKSLFNIGY